MSAIEPINAIFALLGSATLGLTGLAVGPLAAPMLILLAVGARLAVGG